MLNIKLIKRRIKSAGNISQITRAMEMVAASKMKKAQDTALKGKPYADKIYQVVRELASKVDWRQHPLLSPGKESGKSLIILISTNKGLCGGLNTNLFRYLMNWLPKDMDAEFISVGNKGKNIIVKWNKKLVADFSQVPFSSDVPAITKLMVDGFNSGSYKDVFLVYNNFITALTQEPVKKLILPITRIEKGADEKGDNTPEQKEQLGEFVFEPVLSKVLDRLLPHYLENQLRTAIYEAEASEQSARMIAMKNATDAAYDLIDDLTLLYNKARQEKITSEISDMVTARIAVS